MLDFTVFDSFLDSVFVVDQGGKVVYCNDAAATFCQSSVRRMVGKAVLSDLITVEEAGLLPFDENSLGRSAPTPFIETGFRVVKAERTGKAQLAVRPVDAGHWIFYLRDVTLEEALHSKYRSELAQKEDYARNLEKLVEARTAELNKVNQTLNAILNSLGQGFFIFDQAGDCGAVYTRACEDVLEGSPKGRKVWDVLAVPESDREQFRKWSDTAFQELLPFEDLKTLGPNLFPHSHGKYVVLDYFPIRRDGGDIGEIVAVATDKTEEHRAQTALEAERQYAAMIVKYLKNKEQFTLFLASVRRSLAHLRNMASRPMGVAETGEAFRVLHTLEGEAGTFSLSELRMNARGCQHLLEPHKGAGVPDGERERFRDALAALHANFEKFLDANRDVIRPPEDADDTRSVELSLASVHEFLNALEAAPGATGLAERYRSLFLTVAVEDRLKYFDGLVQTVAEKLGKKVKPLEIRGGDLRVFPEPYQDFFASLVHAFRNAVDHGLETAEEREWAGKDPAGRITVDVTRTPAGDLSLVIRDDGKGIDPAAIREKLRARFPERDFSSQSDDDVIQNICLPGFSSRESVGEFSGRGVGLDALKEEVLKLGGGFHIKSKQGEGTAIEIILPEPRQNAQLRRSA
jgi:two-component system chemotaxis sensor kinase CheA